MLPLELPTVLTINGVELPGGQTGSQGNWLRKKPTPPTNRQRKIQGIEKATPAPVDHAIDMLRLTSRASELFLQQPASEQRRLLQTVVEEATWKDGTLQTALFEPFEILRHSNQENSRTEKEK